MTENNQELVYWVFTVVLCSACYLAGRIIGWWRGHRRAWKTCKKLYVRKIIHQDN